MNFEHKTHKEEQEFVDVSDSESKFLILHNDDYHTFDYVIDALISICEHNVEQAVQCTYLVHYKGKADVKKGTYNYLKPMMSGLRAKDLKATIE
jgi:ATP-dependent Clp protease adaptor protein ClpS